MSTLKPDKIHLTSLIDTFLNYDTLEDTITISGTVVDGAADTFSTTFAVETEDILAAVYAKNQNTGKKMSLLAGAVHNPYEAVSIELCRHSVSITGTTLSVDISVTNNSGSDRTLTTQVWEISAVLNRVPS